MGMMTKTGTTIEEDGYEYSEGQVIDNPRNRRLAGMRRQGVSEARITAAIRHMDEPPGDDQEDSMCTRPAL